MNPQFNRDTLAQRGFTVARSLIEPAACRKLAALWPRQDLFRKHIVMQRHGYGQGEYQYFTYPLPEPVERLREAAVQYQRLAAVDHMLCLFPFEPELYAHTRVQARYVGHPLASTIPMEGNKELARIRLGLKRDVTTIAIWPGSRDSEIKHIAPTFFKSATLMHAYLKGAVQFVVPIATNALCVPLNQLKTEILQQCPEIDLHLINGQASSCLEASDSVLIASGTATLEAALWKKPMVISYKVPAITAWIMKRQGYLPYIGLPHILSKKFVVPEILQNDATPQNLAKATLNWLDNPQAVANLESQFIELHHRLRLPTGDLVAQTIQEVIRV